MNHWKTKQKVSLSLLEGDSSENKKAALDVISALGSLRKGDHNKSDALRVCASDPVQRVSFPSLLTT